jgi:SAM-dependent methyltransferase
MGSSINLSPDKESVFREIFRILKPGGELYFSDVFSDRRISEYLRADPVLYRECLAGALYTEDFRRLFLKLGCFDYRIVNSKKITLDDPGVEKKVGMINFYSLTVRAFKLELEDRCEDYGQMAVYLGTIPEFPHSFTLDDHHTFLKGKPMTICGNSADILEKTRYREHFKIIGDKANHYGLFSCSPVKVKDDNSSSCACC